MGKGIKNRGSQIHKVKTKYNRKRNMQEKIDWSGMKPVPEEEEDMDREMEETYTFRQVRMNFNPPSHNLVDMQFEAETLPLLLDRFLDFLVASGYTYVGSLTAHSKLDDKTWTTLEESK
jgi:hypothetical protein